MPKTHAIFNSSKCCFMNNDAMRLAAVATVDLDQGMLVTLDKINRDGTTGKIDGYEYAVVPATAGADNVWIVDSPEDGYDLEMQVHDDPRYFYNVAGKPLSIGALCGGIDCIEITKELFTAGTLPTTANLGQYVAPDADGKYAAPVAVAPGAGAYFRIEGFTTIACGMEEVPAVVMRCMANFH